MTKVHCCCAVPSSVGGLGIHCCVSLASLFPLFFSASHSSALWLRRSGEINKGGLHSFALKHTLAVPHTQDNARGSSLNAIRGSEICLMEPQQNNLRWPVKRFMNTEVWQEAGEEKLKQVILFLAQVKWTSHSTLSHTGKCFSEARAQMVMEIGQQILNPMDESAPC